MQPDHDLLFLLALAPLSLAGCPADEGGDEDDGAMGSTGTSNATAPMTDGTSGTMGGTSMTSATPTSTSSDATTDATSADASSSSGELDCTQVEPPMVERISPVCIAQVEHAVECYGDMGEGCAELYEAYCQYSLDYSEMMFGARCRGALEEQIACINELDCGELIDPMACMEETANAEEFCA